MTRGEEGKRERGEEKKSGRKLQGGWEEERIEKKEK
jgi:hypothetical protein